MARIMPRLPAPAEPRRLTLLTRFTLSQEEFAVAGSGNPALSSAVPGTPFEGFSLSHAAILSGTTMAEGASIYGVQNGTISTDQGNFENTGDDVVLSEHFWINFANVTIAEGFIPFSTIALITGTTVTSSGAAGSDYYALPMWTLTVMNQPTQPMAIRVPAKDARRADPHPGLRALPGTVPALQLHRAVVQDRSDLLDCRARAVFSCQRDRTPPSRTARAAASAAWSPTPAPRPPPRSPWRRTAT